MSVLSEKQAARVIHRTRVLSAGLSGIAGVKIKPGQGWAADSKNRVLIYDLGLAAKLLAAGKDNAITGVIAHEVGHLIYTQAIDYNLLPQSQRASSRTYRSVFHMLLNALEDRRMELLMGKENPGYAQDFLDLQSAIVDTAEWQTLVKAAPVDMQFVMATLLTAYGRKPVTSIPVIEEIMARYEPAIDQMVHRCRSTQDLANHICQTGLWDELVALLKQQAAAKSEDKDDKEEGKSEDDAGEQGQGAPSEGEGEGEESDSDDTDDADGEGSGSDADGSQDDTSPGGALDQDALAQLTRDQGEMLKELIKDTRGSPDPAVQEASSHVGEELEALEDQVATANVIFEQRMTRTGADDKSWKPRPDGRTVFDLYARKYAGQISTLARDLESVLRENSYDRWNGAFQSGGRLNTARLAGTRTGNFHVFKRKVSPKNRKYVVYLLLDVSSSMNQREYGGAESWLAMAHKASVFLLSALEKAGIRTAFYVFGSECVEVKPHDFSLEERKDRIGSIDKLVTGATCMGWALQRVGNDLLSHYDTDDWQKLVIVVTDGSPNDCGRPTHARVRRPQPFVQELAKHGVTVLGIGINTRSVRHIFPHSIVLDDVKGLGRLFAGLLRRTVQKG